MIILCIIILWNIISYIHIYTYLSTDMLYRIWDCSMININCIIGASSSSTNIYSKDQSINKK